MRIEISMPFRTCPRSSYRTRPPRFELSSLRVRPTESNIEATWLCCHCGHIFHIEMQEDASVRVVEEAGPRKRLREDEGR